jgi:hypothetical protein
MCGTVAAGQASFTDSLLLKELHEPLATENVRVPPKELRQIRLIEGTGTLCGVTDHRLHFSENFQPWSWPVEYDMTFPCRIVNMVTVGPTVFISTEAGAYVVTGAMPCSDNLQSRKVREVRPPYPDLGCGRPHSATATPFGMAYSSGAGLTLVKPDASCDVLTGLWYTADQWSRLRPDTARLAYWRGFVFCATDAETLVLEIDPKPYGDGEVGVLTTSSVRPGDMWTTENGELIMLEDGRLMQWNAGDGRMPYEWVSSDLEFDGMTSPSFARVRTRGTTVTLSAGPDLNYTRFVADDRSFRVGRLGRHRTYRLGFTGTEAVESAELGVTELVDPKRPE